MLTFSGTMFAYGQGNVMAIRLTGVRTAQKTGKWQARLMKILSMFSSRQESSFQPVDMALSRLSLRCDEVVNCKCTITQKKKGRLTRKRAKYPLAMMNKLLDVHGANLLRPCLTPGLIRLLRSHRSSTAQLRSHITYSGHGRADIPPLSTTLGLIPVQSLLYLAVYPALT